MSKVLIIAEAGVNHNGSIAMAKKLVDVAEEAGADYVKFQTFKTENLISKKAKKAEYQIKNTGDENESQYEMVKRLELNRDAHETLINYCKPKKIKFLSTAFDHDSIDLLRELGIDLFKIPSGEITNLPYLQAIASAGKPIILSTGMSTLEEVSSALETLKANGSNIENITVLHCNTEYPTPMEDVNLNAMQTIKDSFGVKVGYSDHTLGIEVPIAAVALGAVCIEKHFTLDRNLQGPDHKASLIPEELQAMVKAIRNIETALGSKEKKPSKSELKNIAVARKSIHIKNNVAKGHTLTKNDLVMKRPGNGISPMMINDLIGKTINKSLSEDSMLSLNDLEE